MQDFDDEIEQIQLLLGSDSWAVFLYPQIEKRRQQLNLILLDPRKNKRENTSDDFLRGAISALTWVARLPKNRLSQLVQKPPIHQDQYPELDEADPRGED